MFVLLEVEFKEKVFGFVLVNILKVLGIQGNVHSAYNFFEILQFSYLLMTFFWGENYLFL